MASLSVTGFRSALKQVFSKAKVERLSLTEHPLFAQLKKVDDLYGSSMKVPMILSNPAGISSTFTNAQANKASGRYKDWDISRAKAYGLLSVDYEALVASERDVGAFLKAKTAELEGIMIGLTDDLERSLFGTGSGSVGRVSASTTLSGAVIVLTNPEDALNFSLDRVIKFSSANGGGSLRAGSLKVTAVDGNAGTVTVDANINSGITSPAANDYIFFDGDYDAKIKGLAAWIPDTAPTSGDNFNSVDRSVDPIRLAGHRIDGVGRQVEEVINEAVMTTSRYGAKLTHLWVSYSEMTNIQNSLGAKVQRTDMKVGEVLFEGIEINGPKGKIKIFASPYCPANRMYGLDMSTWELHTMKQVPHLQDLDGNDQLREATADAVEIRTCYFCQLVCLNPGKNCVILR